MGIPFLCVCAFLFVSRTSIKESELYSSKPETDAAKYPGYDMTYNRSESNLAKIKIGEYIWKQKILDILMDPHRSMYEKWCVYENIYLPNQVSVPNVFSGGLLRDWNSDF
jgi:hypothetical protein